MSDQVTRGGGIAAAALLVTLALVMAVAIPGHARAAGEIFPGQDVRLPDNDLIEATRDGNIEGIRDQLMRGIPADDGGISYVPAIIVAVDNGQLEALKYLLAHGAHPDRKARDGRTALTAAAQGGRTAYVSVLLEAGANPDIIADHGDSALFIAVRARRTAIVKLLLDHNADFSDTDITGRTLLDLAEERHYDDIAQLLRAAGA
tara:strand:- start:1116 stop:1727 length:612 start_codon:yes stop_codon:yes gene_type:complete